MNTSQCSGPQLTQNTFSNRPQSKFRNRRTSHSHGCRNPVAGMKLKECHWFSSGLECPFGHNCHFLHKFDGRDVGNADSKGRDGTGIDHWGVDASGPSDKLPSGKPKLCLNWERFRSCPYGANCTFAHGKEDEKSNFYCGCASLSKLASKPISGVSLESENKTGKMLQLKRKRCFSEWDINKISRIYADWKEDW